MTNQPCPAECYAAGECLCTEWGREEIARRDLEIWARNCGGER